VLEAIPADRLTVCSVDSPAPGDAELLIAVEACGICGTDLHILDGRSYRPEPPFVLGHEPVGLVDAVGTGTSAEWIGRRVTLNLFEGCGHCPACASGDERLCPDLVAVRGVIGAWGGFAEHMLVPARLTIDVPPELSAAEVATLVDAGATAANAARAVTEAGVARVAVVGGGPLGLLLAEILRARDLAVTVVEPLDVRRAVLRELGHTVAQNVESLDPSFEAVVDCAGVPSVVQAGLSLLEPHGLFLVVGYCTVSDLDLSVVARRELRIHGVRSGSREHLSQILELAANREIRLPPISTWDLDEINEALVALRSGQVAGKAVIQITHREQEAWRS
jgi:2-desacetyl-2-hydroxyethyl bacteriochlorophyllide A dehydrogenase